ncbi:MAG: hypothetical protein JSW10_00955 [Pseudomonadota bacterium]|nr:MAG: hypothetical protein JSW10_00955 [Pseudomonadota bacterium]
MKDSIQLSDALIEEMIGVMAKHDSDVREDATVALQYLAAVIGYLCSHHPGSDEERNALIEHLSQFTRHVADQHAEAAEQPAAQAAPPAAPAGHIEPDPNDPAAGVWRADK